MRNTTYDGALQILLELGGYNAPVITLFSPTSVVAIRSDKFKTLE